MALDVGAAGAGILGIRVWTDIVCPYGGEEFLRLLLGIDADFARSRAEGIRQKAEVLMGHLEGKVVHVTHQSRRSAIR